MPSFIKHVEHLALYQALDFRVPASEVLMSGREGETVTPPGRGWGESIRDEQQRSSLTAGLFGVCLLERVSHPQCLAGSRASEVEYLIFGSRPHMQRMIML